MRFEFSGRRTALAVTLALFGVSAVAAPLLQPTRAALDENDSVIAGLLSERSTESVTNMQLDASALAFDSASIEIVLGPKKTVTVFKLAASYSEDGSLIWEGAIDADFNSERPLVPEDLLNTVILVKSGNEISGTLRIDGRLHKLMPTASGHVMVSIDESKLPPDHPAEAYHKLFIDSMAPEKPRLVDGTSADKAISTIRVMVVITNAAKAKIGNITTFANLAISETNTGYTNSGVEINMQLAGLYSTSYVESGSFTTDLSRFRGTTDGYMDSIHSLRNTNAADVVMLIIDNGSSCGLASAIGASATTAFAAAHYSCSTGYYSFGHEIGHLQSARHDPLNDPTTTPYAYGHGYQYPAGAWRTIMAYACSSATCNRINYWSNPAKLRSGVPMGTTTKSHNQRVLNNTKATIAAFR